MMSEVKESYYQCQHCNKIYRDQVRLEPSVCPHCHASQATTEPWNDVIRKRFLGARFVDLDLADKADFSEYVVQSKQDVAGRMARSRGMIVGLLLLSIFMVGSSYFLYKTYKKSKQKVFRLTESIQSQQLSDEERSVLKQVSTKSIIVYNTFVSDPDIYRKMALVYKGSEKRDSLREYFGSSTGLESIQCDKILAARSSRTGYLEVLTKLKNGDLRIFNFIQGETRWLLDWEASELDETNRFLSLRDSLSEEVQEFRFIVEDYFPDFHGRKGLVAFTIGHPRLIGERIESEFKIILKDDHKDIPKIREAIEEWNYYRENYEELHERDRFIAGVGDRENTARLRLKIKFDYSGEEPVPVLVGVEAAHWLGDYETGFYRREMVNLRKIIAEKEAKELSEKQEFGEVNEAEESKASKDNNKPAVKHPAIKEGGQSE